MKETAVVAVRTMARLKTIVMRRRREESADVGQDEEDSNKLPLATHKAADMLTMCQGAIGQTTHHVPLSLAALLWSEHTFLPPPYT